MHTVTAFAPLEHASIAAMLPAIMTTGSSEWDRRMADYLTAAALQQADERFGGLDKANEVRGLRDIRLQAKYGTNFRNVPAARRILEADFPAAQADDDLHCEDYCKPLWTAQRALVSTPAPNLAAALFKVNLIEQAEIHLDGVFEGDPFDFVTADFARLAQPAPDAEIVAAWEARKAAFERYNALSMPDDASSTRDASEDERAEWAIIDAAEATIKDAVATTVRGVTIQLWVAFQHTVTARADDEAAQAGNLSYFADDSERDWNEKLTLAALRSLAAIGA